MTPRKSAPVTKQDLHVLEQRLNRRIESSQQEILRHFDLTIETIRHDLLGANADEVASLTDRVDRLDRHVGLAPA